MNIGFPEHSVDTFVVTPVLLDDGANGLHGGLLVDQQIWELGQCPITLPVLTKTTLKHNLRILLPFKAMTCKKVCQLSEHHLPFTNALCHNVKVVRP